MTAAPRVLVTSRLQSRSWETEDGHKRSAVEIEAEEVGASMRWATLSITEVTKAGAHDEANEPVPEEVPA